MYARIARFEEATSAPSTSRSPRCARSSRAWKAGEMPTDAPEEVRTLMETVARFMQLVDRESATFVGITFCETEEQMRRADEALNRHVARAGAGGRTAVDIFEVAIDQELRPTGRAAPAAGGRDVAAVRHPHGRRQPGVVEDALERGDCFVRIPRTSRCGCTQPCIEAEGKERRRAHCEQEVEIHPTSLPGPAFGNVP